MSNLLDMLPRQNWDGKLVFLFIYFSSGASKLPLTPKVSLLPKIKKSFLRLSIWDDEL